MGSNAYHYFLQGLMPWFNGFKRINGNYRVHKWDFNGYVLQSCIHLLSEVSKFYCIVYHMTSRLGVK